MWRDASIVTTVPPVMIRSTWCCDWAGRAVATEKNRKPRKNFFMELPRLWPVPMKSIGPGPELQIRRIEWARQQFRRTVVLDFAIQVRENHGHVAAKFPDNLAASAAGRRQLIRVGDNGDGAEFTLAFRDCLENGNALGANCEAVAGVFDVAAAENAAGFRAHSRAHAKLGKRRVGMFARLARRSNQFFLFAHDFLLAAINSNPRRCAEGRRAEAR